METILNILREINPTAQVDETTELMEEGVLDSMSMVMFVSALCNAYDVDISLRDVVPENFATPECVRDFIAELCGEEV
ncbi:MAG: acyl carrier protein [Clostridiales bacterium]|nr:acyl carrier protein [Clostridiales bacterium]